MGFLFHVVKLRFPRAISQTFIFLNLWSHLKFVMIGALTRIGLYKPPPEDHHSADYSNNYIFILEGTSPSPVPIPIQVVTAAIKRRVPVVKLQDLNRNPEENMCTICFEGIDLEDEVRELCRCSHVFHRDCLDTWVDSGQVYCPLCRSMLLPPKTNLSRCAAIDPSPPPQQTNPADEDNAPLATG